MTGDISARLFPWPHIRLKGVKVANVPGGLITDVVRAETVEARMLLGSLLGGRVEVSNIRIVKPVFSFERLDTSEVNWWLTPQFTGKAPVDAERVSIEDLEIVDGTVFISDTRRGGTAQFDDVDMFVSAQSLLGPWKAKGQLVQNGRPFSIGISTATYKAGEPFGFTFRFSPVEGPGLVYVFDGAYSAASDEPLTGTITAEPYVAASGKSYSQSKVRRPGVQGRHRLPRGPCASAQHRDRARRPRACRQHPDRQRGHRAPGAHLGDGRSRARPTTISTPCSAPRAARC